MRTVADGGGPATNAGGSTCPLFLRLFHLLRRTRHTLSHPEEKCGFRIEKSGMHWVAKRGVSLGWCAVCRGALFGGFWKRSDWP